MRKNSLYWLLFGGALWAARTVQLCFLYLMDSPAGGPLVDSPQKFLPYASLVEMGVSMAIALTCGLISLAIKKDSAKKIFGIFSVIFGSLYLILSGCDDEVMRWMSQHLSFSYLGTYSNAASDPGLVGRIFLGGLFHFSLNILFALGVICLLFFLNAKLFKHSTKVSIICLSILFFLSAIGLTSKFWLNPNSMRWKRIAPVAFNLSEEILYTFSPHGKRDDFSLGVTLLGGDSSNPYPFWKVAEGEAASFEAFKNLPLEEKPDIILLTIETFRGWVGDMRIQSNCENFKNLCALARAGTYFPNAHSVGYPSVEGFLGIHTGMWSHPRIVFLSDRAETKMRTLPDILKEAGYHRELLTATSPNFDNLDPWFNKWYDKWEYDKKNGDDLSIANRFKELYANTPKDKPLFFNWMTTSMHVPYTLPESFGETPLDQEEAYIRAVAFMDSAVGIVLDEIQKSERKENTIIILTGDHAMANNAQHALPYFIGMVHSGYTWVPLIFAGRGIEERIIETPVSHTDIAPTLLSKLGLNVSNHFVGKNILEEENAFQKTFSFRMEDIAMRDSLFTFYTALSEDSPLSVLSTVTTPTWDTAHRVEGFFGEEKAKNFPENFSPSEEAKKLRAAAFAYEYLIDNNLLMP